MNDEFAGNFEQQLDDAVTQLHRRMPRGEMPSARVWSQVNARLQESRVETNADVNPLADQPTPVVAESTPHPPHRRTAPIAKSHTDYLRWSSWFAVAILIGALGIGWYSLMTPANDSQNSIALAPTTPDVSAVASNQIATPAASPQVYDAEFACTVAPLTEEQVYQMVLNPHQFTETYSLSTPPPPKYGFEADGDYQRYRDNLLQSRGQSVTVEDTALRQQLVDTANVFWNCLMTGSALQVWSLMNPVAVQYEVLRYLPILRDEAMVRKFIREWGPRRYSAGITMTFPDLGGIEQYDASKHADESWDTIRAYYMYDGNPWWAEVRMIPHPESTRRWWSLHLVLTLAPDGTWWVATFYGEE
ncbi:MAG: hypothetical protein KC435_08110 [Thermomicrobiales bacterium]|nr:hypothetical protein [Thermomicrobiales bacterium]